MDDLSREYEGTRLKKFKNSLDSDEEDDEEHAKKYNVLDPDEMEGQEEKTIEFDGEIKITPFNMKEELEEGYFDKEGTYIFSKTVDEVADSWLDDIDWVKVKTQESKLKENKSLLITDNEHLPELDVHKHYKKMLNIMKPGETVQKAICRLGKSNAKLSGNRWKRKKCDAEQPEDNQVQKEELESLMSMANDVIQSGNMDIYQQTYEKLSYLVVSSAEKEASVPSYNVDEKLDMFGDKFDVEASASKEIHQENENDSLQISESSDPADNEIMWDFKWELKDDAKVYGPYSTNQMLNWVQEGYFADGVFVRQSDKTDREFYSSKRVDFELYL